jgi:hypothetical protein
MLAMRLAFLKSVDRILSGQVTFDFCLLTMCSEEGPMSVDVPCQAEVGGGKQRIDTNGIVDIEGWAFIMSFLK